MKMEEYKKKKKEKNRHKQGKVTKVIYFYSDRMETKFVTTCVNFPCFSMCVFICQSACTAVRTKLNAVGSLSFFFLFGFAR